MKRLKVKDWSFILYISFLSVLTFAVVWCFLFCYYFVEHIEYVNVDFEWVDDFQNYEVVVPYENKNLYLTIKDSKVKFIYSNEDFLNFVVVDHDKRIIDKKDWFGVREFYINLNYKEVDFDEIHQNGRWNIQKV